MIKRFRSTRSVVFLALAALGACGQESTSPAAVGEMPELGADHVLYNIHHVMTRNGVRSSILDADSAYQREEGDALDLMGVRLSFYAESGAETGTLTSKAGTYSPTAGEFAARDSVVLINRTPSGGQRRIETESLTYNVKNDILWSDAAFVMREDGRTTRGTSFRSEGRTGAVVVTNASTEGGIAEAEGGLSF